MSDNTQPPDRAFMDPNAAGTSYVNTSTLWTEAVSSPNTMLFNSQQTNSIWHNYVSFFSTGLLLLYPVRIMYVHFPHLKVTTCKFSSNACFWNLYYNKNYFLKTHG